MSDQIPTNLRTGLGSPGYVHVGFDETTKRLISMVVVMTRRASDLAFKIAVHDNRDQAEAEDVNSALKYQARYFLSTLDDPDVVADVMETQHDLFAPLDDDMSDDDLPDDDVQEIRASAVMSGNTCVCSMCTDIRRCVASWDTWAPDDEAEVFLRQSVERAITNYEELYKES